MNQKNDNEFISNKIIVLWSVVSAFVPIFISIVETAFAKNILSSDPYASMWTGIVLLIIVFLPISIPWIQWLVLRRVIGKLAFSSWFGAIAIAFLLWQISKFLFALLEMNFSTGFDILLLNLQDEDRLLAIFSLHSLQLIGFNLLHFIALGFAPSLLLGRYSNRSWLLFFIAASIGSIFMTLSEEIYNILHIFNHRTALNGYDWKSRLETFAYIGSLGSVWGMFTMIFLKHLTGGVIKKISFAKDIALGLCIVGLFTMMLFSFALSKHHDITIIQSVIKIFSVTPNEDKSSGKNILINGHFVNIEPTKYPVINFSPNSKTFVMLDDDDQLVLIDVKSGKKLKNISEKISKFDTIQNTWTPDGKYFIVRNSAESQSIPNTHYSANLSSITLYSIPEYKTRATYTYRDAECYDTSDESMAFDGNDTLWILCGHGMSGHTKGSILGYSLKLPTMKLLDLRKYEKERMQIDGILQSKKGAVAIEQEDDQITVHYLSQNTSKTIIADLNKSTLAGSLTGQYATIKDDKIEMFFCGNSNQISNPGEKQEDAKMVHGFCRTLTFDLSSGELIQIKDDGRRKRLELSDEIDIENYFIQSFWKHDSKKGEIVVRDKNKKIIQKIVTSGQILLKTSPDNHWLVTYAFDEKKIRIYEIKH